MVGGVFLKPKYATDDNSTCPVVKAGILKSKLFIFRDQFQLNESIRVCGNQNIVLEKGEAPRHIGPAGVSTPQRMAGQGHFVS